MVFCSLLLLLLAAAPKELAIVKPEIHQYEDGPALAGNQPFHTGDTAFLSFQLENYRSEGREDPKIELACQVDALDPQGVKLAETVARKIEARLAPEDKEWMPKVRADVLIPPLAFGGSYKFEIRCQDLIGKTETKAEVPFRVEGRAVEPSETLVVRNYRFLKTEEDRFPLVSPVYHQGDQLWARFDITGFKYGDGNRIHVEYDISVLGPEGNAMFTQPKAAVEQDSSFYPKRYLPGILSLNLEKNIRPGNYTIVVTVRDEVGGQTVESKHPFQII